MYLDSAFEICRKRGCYVLLDQTRRECAKEHRCAADDPDECPLRVHFTGRDFAAPEEVGESNAPDKDRNS